MAKEYWFYGRSFVDGYHYYTVTIEGGKPEVFNMNPDGLLPEEGVVSFVKKKTGKCFVANTSDAGVTRGAAVTFQEPRHLLVGDKKLDEILTPLD